MAKSIFMCVININLIKTLFMRTLFTKLLILGLAKFLLVSVFILLASISFGQKTENYDDAGISNNQVLANGFAAFDYNGFTYQIISFDGANSSLLDILNWETYGNNSTDAIGVSGALNDKITVFKITKTDGSAFSTSSLWMTSAGDSYTITGYNDGNTTDQSVSVSASFSGIKTLNFTGVDELRFEGTEIIVDLDDFTYTLGAANSAPTATAPSAPSVTEDDTNVALADDIQVADTDGDSQTVSFTITGGTLSTGTTGITFGGNGNGSASFTAAGTLAAINTALDAATFTPTPNLNGTNAGVISFTTNDGTVSSSAASVSFNITAVNDAPIISIDGSVLSYTENNTAIQIDASATVSDPDGDAEWNGGQLAIEIDLYNEAADEISISDTDGDGIAITISGTNIFANGTDIGDLVPSGGVATGGTQLAIGFDSDATNAIVQEVFQSIRYRSTSDNPGTSNRVITIAALDAVLASKTVQRTIGVTAVNDDPTISGLPTDITVSEDIASNVDLSAATFNDVDAGANSIVLTIAASTGTLTAISGGPITIGGSGTGTLSLTGAAVDIDTYLNTASNIKYTGASNVNGNDAATLTLTANDGGYSGIGEGIDVSLGTVNVDITAVNDTPTASSFTASLIYQNTAYEFSTANFSYSDIDSDPIDHLRITAVPSNGTLWLDSDASETVNGAEIALSNNSTVSKADLDAGYLKYLNTTGTSSSFTFDVNDGTAYSASTYTATLSVIPEPTVTLSLEPVSTIAENGGTTNVKATLSHSFNKMSTIILGFSGTALGGGTDYSYPMSTIYINAGVTEASISITSNNDFIDEIDETVIIDITSATRAIEQEEQKVTLTITDDDVPTVGFHWANTGGSETVSSANLRVDLSSVSEVDVTVDYAITGTATGGGTDYTLANGTFTIEAGLTYKNFVIPTIVDDHDEENDETIIVTLSNPTNATLGSVLAHTYTIYDDDERPRLATNSVLVNSSSSATFNGFIIDNGGNNITDHGFCWNTSGSPTIADNLVNELTVSDDSFSSIISGLISGSKYYVRAFVIDKNGAHYGNEVYFTIDNPSFISTPITLASAGAFYTYSSFSDDGSDFSPAISCSTKPDWLSFSGTGSSSYTAFGESIDFPAGVAGDTDGNTYVVCADRDIETNYIYKICPDGTTDKQWAMVYKGEIYAMNIFQGFLYVSYFYLDTDDDTNMGLITKIDLANPSAGQTTVYSSVGGEGLLSMAFKDGFLFVANYDKGKVLKINLTTAETIDYLLVESLFGICFDNNGNLFVASFDTGEILKYDGTDITTVITGLVNPSDVKIDQSGFLYVSEYGSGGIKKYSPTAYNSFVQVVPTGEENAIFGMNLAPNGSLVFGLLEQLTCARIGTGATLSGTPAISDVGYHNIVLTATNSVSSVNQEFIIAVKTSSTLSEFPNLKKAVGYSFTINPPSSNSDGAFTYTSSDNAVATISGNTVTPLSIGTTTITATQAEDGLYTSSSISCDLTVVVLPTVAFNSTSSNASESVSSVNLQVDLSAISDEDVTVDYVVTGTATGGGTDYTLANGTLTISAGAASDNITISSIVDDLLDENNETVVVTLSNPTNAILGTNTVYSYTINDNDATPTVSFTSASQSSSSESGIMTITAQISEISGRDITIPFTINSSSTSTGGGTDYSVTASPLTILSGSTSADISITVALDDIVEGNETIIVNMGSPINASVSGVSTHTATITDDDTAGFTIVESDGSTSVSESGTTDTFTVVLYSQPVSNVVLNIDVDSTDEVATDKSVLTFTNSNWDTPQTVTVNGVDDLIVDGNIIAYVTISVNDVSSSDEYDSLLDQKISVTNIDDDIHPSAETNDATSVSATSAILNGTVNANNQSVSVGFEYGSTSSYGSYIAFDQNPVTGATNSDVSKTITNLLPNTTYYFRVMASSSSETVYGDSKTFTTDKYSQIITFNNLPSKTTDDPDFNPSATSNMGLEVSYSSSNLQIATVVNNYIHIVGPGTCVITAFQLGNDTVYAASSVIRNLSVTNANSVDEPKLFTMHPNPARNILHLEIDSDETPNSITVRIVDLAGKIIFSKEVDDLNFTLDLDFLKIGMYSIQIITPNGTDERKLIIE